MVVAASYFEGVLLEKGLVHLLDENRWHYEEGGLSTNTEATYQDVITKDETWLQLGLATEQKSLSSQIPDPNPINNELKKHV